MTVRTIERPEALGTGPAPLPPSRWRYLLVALLPLTALAAILLWGFAASSAVNGEAGKFVRGPIPGTVVVDGHPGTWSIYAEGPAQISAVSVTDATGDIPVTMSEPKPAGYDQGGTEATQVATFVVAPGRIGQWRVHVSGTGDADSRLAVGEFNIQGFMRVQHWGMGVLFAVNAGCAVAIAVVPVVRRRRGIRTAA